MKGFKVIVENLIQDVNNDEGLLIPLFGNVTDLLFMMIKWGCIPFFLYVLLSFFQMI